MTRGRYFSKINELIGKPKKRHIYMGDFNFDFHISSNRTYRDKNERKLTEVFSASPLINKIERQKTHLSKIHNSLTTTDMILLTPEIKIIKPIVDSIAVMSGLDHFPAYFELKHFFKPPRRLIKSRGKIYQNESFCKEDPVLNLTDKYIGLKTWESDNSKLLDNLNNEWENNKRVVTKKVYDTLNIIQKNRFVYRHKCQKLPVYRQSA